MTYQPRPEATDSERLSAIEVMLCDTHARLFGNGQPGELDKIRTEASKRFGRLRKEIDALNRWRWVERGALCAFAIALKFGPEIRKIFG